MNNLQFSMPRKFGILLSFFATFLFIAISSCDQKPPANSRVAQAQRGKALFQKHCVQCHGDEGRGMRIDSLNTRTADLTQIMSSRKATEFPILQIANIIDGREMAKSHGTRVMPVWGEVFSKEDHMDEKQIKGKMGELIAYLMTIQE